MREPPASDPGRAERRSHPRRARASLAVAVVLVPAVALASGAAVARSEAAPTNTTKPAVSGSAVQGQTLEANVGA